MQTDSASSAPQPASILFARGVIARLLTWPALHIAVSNNWGGPESSEKRTWIASVIVDAFEDPSVKPDAQYIEEMVMQIMADEFETNVEDGSAEDIGRDLVRLWDAIQTGGAESGKGVEMVDKFEAEAEKIKGKKPIVQQAPGSGDDEDSDEWEDESGSDGSEEDEVPNLLDSSKQQTRHEPEIDEDGFTLVKGKGKSHR
ncbi:hypothetical protein ONZ45_g15862 [Pleurotus djamor]|nr:hypothetical protein ONZ45_g15862 [Pleurotus djamor]